MCGNLKGDKKSMKIIVTSVFVQNQEDALEFYNAQKSID